MSEHAVLELPGFKEKMDDIANDILVSAKAIGDQLRIAYPSKRIFPARDRFERVRRQKRKTAQLMLMIMPQMSAAHIMMKMSQPIPRYPEGTDRVYPAISAMVGKPGPEIVSMGMFDVKIENAFTPFARATIKPVPPSLNLIPALLFL